MLTSTPNRSDQSSVIGDPAKIRPHPINVLVGKRLRLRRSWLGISGRELSNFLRVDPSELAAQEAGAKRINANLLLETAKILGVRPDYFFRSEAGATNHAGG
jgi:transcriptional regulator with XRE-family HTH domain